MCVDIIPKVYDFEQKVSQPLCVFRLTTRNLYHLKVLVCSRYCYWKDVTILFFISFLFLFSTVTDTNSSVKLRKKYLSLFFCDFVIFQHWNFWAFLVLKFSISSEYSSQILSTDIFTHFSVLISNSGVKKFYFSTITLYKTSVASSVNLFQISLYFHKCEKKYVLIR